MEIFFVTQLCYPSKIVSMNSSDPIFMFVVLNYRNFDLKICFEFFCELSFRIGSGVYSAEFYHHICANFTDIEVVKVFDCLNGLGDVVVLYIEACFVQVHNFYHLTEILEYLSCKKELGKLRVTS